MRLQSAWWMARLKLDAWQGGGRVELHSTVRLRTRAIFRGTGSLRIDEHAILGDRDAGMPGAAVYFNARNPESFIHVSAHSRLSNGVEIIALERVEIGERVLAGAGARILDSDFHGIAPGERESDARSLPVTIGDGVWLGMSAIILKGVAIGQDAIIGAGSVVVRNVPSGAVVAGHPARTLAMYASVSSAAREARS
jgi:acetyltransferase-like isoleucine patch superfamily enzyme